ncbi:hypothetical protein Hanom_Chr00s150663g01821881 [Helianthus anomalus]
MHPFNRGYESHNPFGYQEIPNPSPPQNRQPTNRGHPQGLVYSLCLELAEIASYIGNCVFTNFPYDESSIPIVNLSQPNSVPETQPQDVGGSSSTRPKKEVIRKNG